MYLGALYLFQKGAMLVSEVFPELNQTKDIFILNCVLFVCKHGIKKEKCNWQKKEKIKLCNAEVDSAVGVERQLL